MVELDSVTVRDAEFYKPDFGNVDGLRFVGTVADYWDRPRVFDAETCLLGIFSGTLGVVIAWLCTFPINKVIENMTELKNCSHLQLKHAIALVIISTVLTMIGGHIPARMAAKKDAVEALRSE